MFCCALLCVHSSFAIIKMGKRELVALLCLSSWCLVIVVWLFLTMPRVCLQFVIVVVPDHTNLLFFKTKLQATGLRSAVGNVSGNRCESDCRSRGREFIPARSHTFVQIDHEIIPRIILLPSTESFKKGCCQLQAKVCARSTG